MKKNRIEEIEPVAIQKRINALIASCDTSHDNFRSFGHLSFNVALSMALFWFSKRQTFFSEWVYFYLYSYIQGTIWMGLWVLGHECGHGAFVSSRWLNDVVGFVIHSALLVPYFSWQYTHAKHHKFTNHLTKGETHVPMTQKGFIKTFGAIQRMAGACVFPILQMITNTMFGWQMYLVLNTTGGRTQADGETPLDKRRSKDHFTPNQIFPKRMHPKVVLSTVGVVGFIAMLMYCLTPKEIFYWYVGPYVIVNGWLVMYTFLQHTHENIPHFANPEYEFIHGALSTIDRPYNWLTNFLHHDIGSTHILHHINYKIPHYRAKAITPKLRKLLEEEGLYNYDDRPALLAYYQTLKRCNYVDKIEGVQYFS